MKIIISILAAAIGSFVLGLFLPWWSIIIVPFILGATMDIKNGSHMLSGFLGIGLLWTILAALAANSNAADLAPMIGRLFGGMPSMALVFVTGLIGGMYGAIAQLSGSFLQKLLKKKS